MYRSRYLILKDKIFTRLCLLNLFIKIFFKQMIIEEKKYYARLYILEILFENKKNLINKFSKHNRVKILSFKIKYLDLYMSLGFWSFIFRYR